MIQDGVQNVRELQILYVYLVITNLGRINLTVNYVHIVEMSVGLAKMLIYLSHIYQGDMMLFTRNGRYIVTIDLDACVATIQYQEAE